MPQHFAFDGTDWGHHTEYDQFSGHPNWEYDNFYDNVDHFAYEESFDNSAQYGFALDDADIDQQVGASEYEVVNTGMHLLQGESSSSSYNVAEDGEAEEASDHYYDSNFEDSAQ
jgi:hypothetical protein